MMLVGRTGGLAFVISAWSPLMRIRGFDWRRIDNNEYGRWPGKKFLGSFWQVLKELDINAARDVESHVFPDRNADEIFQFLLRRLVNEYQQWNPYRPVRAAPEVVS